MKNKPQSKYPLLRKYTICVVKLRQNVYAKKVLNITCGYIQFNNYPWNSD